MSKNEATFSPVADVATIAKAQAAVAAYPKTISLPGGGVAVQARPLKGRDAVAAHRICGKEPTDIEITAALVAQVVTLNGKQAVMEDVLDMDLEDLTDLAEAVAGKSLSSTRKA